MNSTLKNVILFLVVLVLSYFASPVVGGWYDGLSPQYGSLFFDKSDTLAVIGFLMSYTFIMPLLFGLFGIAQNKKLIFWLLLPAVLLVLSADKAHFYIPLGLVLAGLAVSWLFRQVWLRVGG